MRLTCCCSALLTFLFLCRACRGGNILVFPIEGSHWVNMEILMRELHSQGHNLTIVRPSKTWYMKDNASYFHTISVPVEKSLDKDFITSLVYEIIEYERGALPIVTFLHMSVGMFGMFMEAHQTVGGFTTAILDNKDLLRTLKDSNFDLVLIDPCWGAGVIVAKYLDLPVVYNVRWIIATEAHIAIAPSPLSYIPITGTGNTNKMSFLQRVKNVFVFLVGYTQHVLVIKNVYQKICDKYLGSDVDMHHLLASADLWLMRVDFVFEFPRPTMPNIVYMGGFQCKPAGPLPDHLEDFVQSSGEHGVILMSLGTFVNELAVELADKIAADFAKLPQKVIWRYKGEKPSTLGNNTLLVDWMPQNDLLGHPKMKLFVAHGGTNGVQEAIYHGVPVVGIPLFFDQHDNLLRLSERGAAVVVTLALLDKDDIFLKAMQEVIANQTYRNNMQRLSRLHKDKPISPLNNAIFWIEFVMRHKGAAHLKTDSYKMPSYIYYCFDVYLFLTGAVLALFLVFFFMTRCMCSALWRGKIKRD